MRKEQLWKISKCRN